MVDQQGLEAGSLKIKRFLGRNPGPSTKQSLTCILLMYIRKILFSLRFVVFPKNVGFWGPRIFNQSLGINKKGR